MDSDLLVYIMLGNIRRDLAIQSFSALLINIWSYS